MKRLLLVAACLTLGAPAQGATGAALSIDALTGYARLIVRGTVTSVQTVHQADRGTMTLSRIAVTDSVKGSPSAELIVASPGGQIPDGDLIWVPGTPRFQKGEDVLLYLEPGRGRFEGFFRTVGMAQGKFRVQARTGNATVSRSLTGLSFVEFDDKGRLVTAPAPPIRLGLAQLLNATREAMSAEGTR